MSCPNSLDYDDNDSLLYETIIQPLFGANKLNSDQYTITTISTNDTSKLWNCPASTETTWKDNNSNVLAMPALCGTVAWDGETNPAASIEKNPLISTVVPSKTQFLRNCNTSSSENNFRQSFCSLQCAYDPRLFKTLDQVQAWEQKYGKYVQNVDNDLLSVSSDQVITTDTTDYKVEDDASFTGNYNSIMQNFCAQPVSDATKCFIDPMTGKSASMCSNLFSYTPEGQACRFWLNSFGPKKFEQMSFIGKNYCEQYSNETDSSKVPSCCKCYLRNYFPEFQSMSSEMPVDVKAGCYYLPCADPTNYLIGTDVMGTYSSDSSSDNSTYGLTCGNDICVNVLKVQTNDATVKNNQAYIQCGSGNEIPKSFFGKMNYYLRRPHEYPGYFTLAFFFYLLLSLVLILFVFGLLYGFRKLYNMK